jgi:8-oxo-dGTP pyrophosphatase MutT (NUDIX family)
VSTPLHADAVRVLTGWAAPDGGQERLRSAYLEHLARHDDGVFVGCVPAHLTASAMVLDHTGDRVLLTLHRKGGFWSQLGGHCEPGDASLADAALREAREESGIADLRLVGAPAEVAPVELDRHRLSAAFGRCGEHLDVRYAAVAPEGAAAVISDESDDLAWFPVGALPAGAVEDLGRLARRAQAALRAQLSDRSSPAVADTPSRYPRARSVRG